MNLMNEICQHLMRIRYEDLSASTVEMVKKLTIDTAGVTIAGSSAEGSGSLVDLVKGWGGKEESTVLVYGGKLPAVNAALVNCTMARARDLDDVHEGGGGHLAATFVPAALILAEYAGRPVSGKELILAIALGSDLSCRLRCAMLTYRGWIAETFAPFGVVAMGAKLLGFTEAQLVNGLGLAYSQCTTNAQAYVDGALSGRVQQGIGAKGGILATLLAQIGFTGAKDVFQGKYGFYPLYMGNEYAPESITQGLGKEFQITYTSIKPYSCCKFTHLPIYATLEIISEYNLDPREIVKVTVDTNSTCYSVTGVGENKYRPQNPVDAQFSIPYTVATAALRKKVFIDDFDEESIRRGDVLEFARKVVARVDPELDSRKGFLTVPNRVEVKTQKGNCYTKYVEFVKGHPKNPMSMDECIEKFHNCLRFSAKALEGSNVEMFVASICDLENVGDVRALVKLLT